MLCTKIYKNQFDQELYANYAVWCNQNNATIEDKGEYYEVVEIPSYIPTEAEIQKRLTDGVQNWMDNIVQERNYDSVHTCVGTYLYSPIDKFRIEAEHVKDWVSYVWDKCYAMLAQVKNGEREIPTLEEVINELPRLEWGINE